MDLGVGPLANSFVTAERLQQPEVFHPLCVWVCDQCRLAQIENFVSPQQRFSEYVYFSSYSQGQLHHAKVYSSALVTRFGLNEDMVSESLGNAGLRIFDVERLPTHGGSLRVFACLDEGPYFEQPAVKARAQEEHDGRLYEPETHSHSAERVVDIKCDVLDFLIRARQKGKTVCGYGAAGKATTFVNYCGIGPELLCVVADRNPHKQGTWMPGKRIRVVTPEDMLAMRPNYVLILAWNLRDEIANDLAIIREWDGRFVTAIPALNIF